METVVTVAESPNGIVIELPSEFELEPGTRLSVTRNEADVVLTPLPPEPEDSETYTWEGIRTLIAPIADSYGVERIWVYGAYADKQPAPGSTVRLLVQMANRGDISEVLPELIKAFKAPVQVVDERNKDKVPAEMLGEPKLVYGA